MNKKKKKNYLDIVNTHVCNLYQHLKYLILKYQYLSLKPTRVKVLYAICKILSKEFIDVVLSMIPITRKENYNM